MEDSIIQVPGNHGDNFSGNPDCVNNRSVGWVNWSETYKFSSAPN
jgi:hypothetical protein